MGKEQEKRPQPDLKRKAAIALWLAASAGVGVKAGIAVFNGLTEKLEQKPAIEEEVQNWKLIPTYTPTPKIEVTPTPQPEATPVPKIEIILEPPAVPEEESEEEAEVFRDLSQQYPEVWQELPSRAENVIAYAEKINQINPNSSVYQDYRIFEKYGRSERNLSLTKENLMFVLAWYELEYAQPIEQNPNFQRAIEELAPAIKVINEIVKDKVSSEEFIGKEIPQLPEDPRQSLIFSNVNGGGYFIAEIYVIEEMKGPNPENYQHLLEYLAGIVPHELIHAWPQALFANQGSSWSHEKDYEIKKGDTLWDISQEYGLKVDDILEINLQIENPDLIFPGDSLKIPQKGEFIFPENRKFHLAHMAMCSLTAPAQEKLGFEPGIEPRIIYIYSRLKENGVEDSYGLIVRAGIKMRGEELWEVYESVRQEDDLSIDELISTNDPVPGFNYHTKEEREAFRAEYLPYISIK